MNKISIHQFTPTLAYGDGVSNGLLFTQKILQELGFCSNIYICDTFIDKEFKSEIYHISQYPQSPTNYLLYHHSIGHICHDNIMQFKDKKILVYHNITPAHFFSQQKHLQDACNNGRQQLEDAQKYMIASYADSFYNTQELLYYNYKNPVVLPLLINFEKKKEVIPSKYILQKYKESFNILFVGRIVQNKAQHQLIDVAYFLKKHHINFKLFIVGGASQNDYLQYLKNYTKNLELEEKVIFTGKVNNENLEAYYQNSDLYLSLSEHEGFGIPLIEAMKYDIPIFAYNAGAINTTITKQGVLEKKAATYVAQKIIDFIKNPIEKVNLLKAQKKLLQQYSYEQSKQNLYQFLNNLNITAPTPVTLTPTTAKNTTHTINIQIEGAFDSTYSLAIVNKNIAQALSSKANVKLHSTEGNGDFEPKLENLPKSIQLLATKKLDNIDITIRNTYPPRTNAMKGYHKIIGVYGWEESKFPPQYTQGFNTKLTMVLAMSNYVKNLLKNNGVYIPIVTTGIVVEDTSHILSAPFSFTLPQGFKLLHISSSFPRKGTEILLEMFTQLKSKDTALIIKTFPNPHNNILTQLKAKKFIPLKTYEENITLYTNQENSILLINKDISQNQLKYLYENSNALVAPSFGEGFGLPLAEAMLHQLPVITTAYSGQTDFCTQETAWLVDFEFQEAKTHMQLHNSLWAVPKLQSLKEQIIKIQKSTKEQLQEKTVKAKVYIEQNYSLKAIEEKITQAIQNYPKKQFQPNIGLFSTFNTKCGIAKYSASLIKTFEEEVIIFANQTKETKIKEDTPNTIRCWKDAEDTNNIEELKIKLIEKKTTTLIIQYNFSFIPLFLLKELIEFCTKQNITTHLFLHSTKDVITKEYTNSLSTIEESLQKVTAIHLHTLEDINYLKAKNIYKNTYLFSHGIDSTLLTPQTIQHPIPIIATFGFLLPQKGIFELIDAAEQLHKQNQKINLLLLTAIHPAPISSQLAIKLKEKIENSPIKDYITLNTNFLEEKEIISQLSNAQKIVYLYNNTQESSSAAVRMGILSQKEVITTPLKIFDDVKNITTQTEDFSQEAILKTLKHSLLKNYDNTYQLDWIKENSWNSISYNFHNTLLSSP